MESSVIALEIGNLSGLSMGRYQTLAVHILTATASFIDYASIKA
jgi:hypothetical protein